MKSLAAARGRRSTTSSASWLLMDERLISTHIYVRASVCPISAAGFGSVYVCVEVYVGFVCHRPVRLMLATACMLC
jgi:hypothetical protein